MAINSHLNIELKISENGLTPDSTEINGVGKFNIVPKGISIFKRNVSASTVVQIVNADPGANMKKDYYAYIKNIGTVNFDVRSSIADGDIFGVLAPGDFSFIKMKKELDLYVKNLSSSDLGKIEVSSWQAKYNVA